MMKKILSFTKGKPGFPKETLPEAQPTDSVAILSLLRRPFESYCVLKMFVAENFVLFPLEIIQLIVLELRRVRAIDSTVSF